MNELLSDIIRAHGGLSRWRALSKVEATVALGGGLWALKGVKNYATPYLVTADLHRQQCHARSLANPDCQVHFTPDKVAIAQSDGCIVGERRNPRAFFTGYEVEALWDSLDASYFTGYAVWIDLTMPFSLARQGVRVFEIEPLAEKDETWSVLRAEFADSIATHGRVQDFYFGDDLLLRRHDYNIDVAGEFAAMQLSYDYKSADGIRLPSRQRVYLRTADGRADSNSLMVAIDISDIHFS